FQAEDGIRDATVTGLQTSALQISRDRGLQPRRDEGWLLVFASAVYNTVAHDVDCRSISNDTRLTAPQMAQQLVGRLAARLQRELLLECRALGRRNPQFRLVTVPFNLTLPARFGRSFGQTVMHF